MFAKETKTDARFLSTNEVRDQPGVPAEASPMHHKVQSEVIVRHGSDTHGEGRDLYALSLKMIDEGNPNGNIQPQCYLSWVMVTIMRVESVINLAGNWDQDKHRTCETHKTGERKRSREWGAKVVVVFGDLDERGVWSLSDLKCSFLSEMAACPRFQPVVNTVFLHWGHGTLFTALAQQYTCSMFSKLGSHWVKLGKMLKVRWKPSTLLQLQTSCGCFLHSLWTGKDASEFQSSRIEVTSNILRQAKRYRFVFLCGCMDLSASDSQQRGCSDNSRAALMLILSA